jgi:hypothetical protein
MFPQLELWISLVIVTAIITTTLCIEIRALPEQASDEDS